MKVLWIVGLVFPEALKLLKGSATEIKATGGWIVSSADALSESLDVQLSVAVVTPMVNKLVLLQGENRKYFLLPPGVPDIWINVKKEAAPDVIHIHGTENLDNIINFLNVCGSERVVISMQGIRNAIGNYWNAGISPWQRITNITIADIHRQQLLWNSKNYKVRSEKERFILQRINHVIGRTITDKSYTWYANHNLKYHFCNETLREEFYDGCWEYDKCTAHTIFLSQASRPLKGLHIVLKALPELVKLYPDLKLRIAGENFIRCASIKDRIKLSGYGKLISSLIKKYKLEDRVIFTGPLNAMEMKQEYLNSNLFLNPSTIENSPNSLCEAQILGVPCLSSYVGGVPDIIPNDSCGEMYRFDEVETLSYKISSIFESSYSFDNSTMREIAMQRHNRDSNVARLIQIYNDIINC